MSNLHELAAKGQSIWLDDLRRALVTTGELKRMLEEDVVTGVTSNPTIFAKAISGSTDYDRQLQDLIATGCSTQEAFVALVVEDIKGACDIFRPTWEKSNGRDGYASVEVSPSVAHDAEATIEEALVWAERVKRDNVLVKVPATREGVEAVAKLTSQGLSINVTLIFSLERYRSIAEAYIEGLEQFAGRGGDPSTVTSVASFFVSRVDVEIDRRLDELADRAAPETARRLRAVKGRAGIANARTAYGVFKQLFSGERWARLEGQGARPQRPLWASTGVKDPAYRDTMYVEDLIAPDTINTMPESTIRAFQDHGDTSAGPFGESDIAAASGVLAELAAVGIDYSDVTEVVLENEGIAKFEASFNELTECLEAKRKTIQKQHRRWRLSGVEVKPDAALGSKIWTKDPSAWAAGEDDPARRLGWLTLPDSMEGQIVRLEQFARSVVEAGINEIVLLGMGGSSLAPEVFARTFGSAAGYPSMIVLDSTHPAQISAVTGGLDLDRALFLVSSKSGGTIETISLYRYFRSLQREGSHYVAITDPGTSLEKLAEEEGFRATFLNPTDIGGRYSALSFFGLVPAALIGADIAGLLSSALEQAHAVERSVPAADNPGLVIGTAIAGLARRGRDKLTFIVSDAISSLGDWLEQLVAESTGKRNLGIVPIVGEPEINASGYPEDRAFVSLRLAGDDSNDLLVARVKEAGHPVVSVNVPQPIDVGGEMFRWEFATAVAGAVLGINAFDQPDVESAKRASRALLDSQHDIEWDAEDPEELFEGMGRGEVAALLAFAPRSAENDRILASARRRLVSERGVATMSGFGPRYLHSTGQLLKGGPRGVRALVVLDPPDDDVRIPGSSHGFARLVAAQALGDARALQDAGRRVATTTWEVFERWALSA